MRKRIVKFGSIALAIIALAGCSASKKPDSGNNKPDFVTSSSIEATQKVTEKSTQKATATTKVTKKETSSALKEAVTEASSVTPTEKPTEAPTEQQTERYVPPTESYISPTEPYVPPTEASTEATTEAPVISNEKHMNILGLDYIVYENTSDRILTSEAEIVQAMLDGFNYGRAKCGERYGLTEEQMKPLALDEPLASDCKAWANTMASEGKLYHSDMKYLLNHFEKGSGSEGVGNMNIDAKRVYPMSDGSFQNICTEYENYVSYKTAFAKGESLCYHIQAQAKNVLKVGIGIAFGRDDDIWNAVDYYCCIAITYN